MKNERLLIRGQQMGKQTESAKAFVEFMRLMKLGETVATCGTTGMKIFKLVEIRKDGTTEKYKEKKDGY